MQDNKEYRTRKMPSNYLPPKSKFFDGIVSTYSRPVTPAWRRDIPAGCRAISATAGQNTGIAP
jgi:hypothetical protein